MNALPYFSVFMLIIIVIFAVMTWVDYRRRKITRLEARYRFVVALAVCLVAILFVVIAGVLRVSVFLVIAGFACIVIVVGVIAYAILVRR